MNTKHPQPVHESYRRHRRELVWQIILPVALAALIMVALIVLINVATFNQNGDVARWAAISTIWIVIPIIIILVILLVLLGGLVYLMKKLLDITPTYTGLVQHYVYKAAGYITQAADMAVKPVLGLEGIKAGINVLFGRK